MNEPLNCIKAIPRNRFNPSTQPFQKQNARFVAFYFPHIYSILFIQFSDNKDIKRIFLFNETELFNYWKITIKDQSRFVVLKLLEILCMFLHGQLMFH